MNERTYDAGGEQLEERQRPVSEQVTAPSAGVERDPTSPTEDTSPESWTTAALSHASILLTLLLAFAGGIGAIVGLAIPLTIYLSNRDRSRFIAFQALQSLVYQSVGILIYLVLAIVLGLAVTLAWTVSGALSAVGIGFLLMPWALMITILMVVLLLGAPLAWVAYGLCAGYRVYQGDAFHYWLLGEWLEREVSV